MKIMIIELRDGEVTFASEIGSGMATATSELRVGHEYHVELSIKEALHWGKEIEFAVSTAASMLVHNGQCEICAHLEAIEEGGIIVLRLDESTTLMLEAENRPLELPIGSWLQVRTDSLELFPNNL